MTMSALQSIFQPQLPTLAPPEDLAQFVRQLGQYLEEGHTVPSALHLLRQLTVSPQLQQVAAGLAADIERGVSYREAFSNPAYTDVCGPIFGHCVAAQATDDDLRGAMQALALHYDQYVRRAQSLRRSRQRSLTLFVSSFLAVCGGAFLALTLALHQ